MRVAFFSDLHGNLPALDACLEDIGRQAVDLVVCGGDIVNPLWTSGIAIDRILDLGIPLIRGNHEDYICNVVLGGASEEMRTSPRWLPVRNAAERIGAARAEKLRSLPLEIELEAEPGSEGSAVYFCHASPGHNARTPISGIDTRLAEDLDATRASAVVSGHWHLPWSAARVRDGGQPQLLVAAGSAGLPMRGSAQSEYVVVTYRRERGFAGWTAEARSVLYDQHAALREFRESGALDAGGPIAWCLYDELATAQKRLGYLFPLLREQGRDPQTLKEWEDTVRIYLKSLGRWDFIRSQLQDGGGR